MFILSEDPPLASKGHGLSVLLYNLFNDAGIEIKRWYTFIPQRKISVADIRNSGIGNIQVIDGGNIFSIFRRWGKLNELYNQALFLIYFPWLLADFKKDPDRPVFIPIGASAWVLIKIRLIQRFTNNPVWIYQVDDVNEIVSRLEKTFEKWLCGKLLKTALIKAERCFAISDGLAAVLTQQSGKTFAVILPCFKKEVSLSSESAIKAQPCFTFIFTGGLSFLYNDSLKLFAHHLIKFQQEHQAPCKLIIQTYSPRIQFDMLDLPGAIAEYRTTENRSDLRKTYEECDAFLVPYGFNPVWKPIVSTSFPQKVAQIIQFGRPLVIFGPAYGSVSEFFGRHNLAWSVTSDSYETFEITMMELIRHHHDEALALRYQQIWKENFSQQACLAHLKPALS